MNECWDEGGLRAYFDRELPPEELAKIAGHIGACAECHTRYNEVAARAMGVGSMMNALAVEGPIAPAPSLPIRRWAAPAAAAILAAAVLAFVLVPKQRAARPQPVAAPRGERVQKPIQAHAPSVEPAGLTARGPAKVAHVKVAHRAQAPETDYYLALDDEPIDIGVVMRVALTTTVSSELASAPRLKLAWPSAGDAKATSAVEV